MEDTDSGVVAAPRTKDELLSRARAYARTVDLAVDLDAIDWECSNRAKRRAGACRYDAETGRVTIRLTWDAYREHGWGQFRETIRHELIHAWEFQEFGESSHGARFEQQAADLDVDVHCEAFTEPRLRATCLADGCDWALKRYRASETVTSPETYACGQCGSDYEVVHCSTDRSWQTAAGYERQRAMIGEEW